VKSLSIRMFASLALGLLAGAALAAFLPTWSAAILAVTQQIGALWLGALTMTVTPLVFGLVVNGVATPSTADSAARRAFVWFAALLVCACAISCLVTRGILSLAPPMSYQSAAASHPLSQAPSIGDWLSNLMPTNPVKAAAETAIVPLVTFALLFGLAARQIAAPLRTSLLAFIQALVETILVVVRWVLLVGPVGVAALAVGVGVQIGAGAFAALLHYVLVVSAACLTIAGVAYLAAVVFGRMSPIAFARASFSAQTVAFSTQSSLASLPVMVAAGPALGVAGQTAGVVLPLAVSVFRAASAAANVAVTVYLAQVHGVALGVAELTLLVVVAAIVSVGAVGLPAQVSFFATIAPICLAVDVPITMLPLLLAVESVPDLFRTVGNVTADLAVTRIVGRDDGSALAGGP